MTHRCSRHCMATRAILFWSLKGAIHPTLYSHALIDDVQHAVLTFNDDLIMENFNEIWWNQVGVTLKFALKSNTQQMQNQCDQRQTFNPGPILHCFGTNYKMNTCNTALQFLQWTAGTGNWRIEIRPKNENNAHTANNDTDSTEKT